jgi:hypothetical protein
MPRTIRILCSTILAVALALAADAFVGTWKLNLAKSKWGGLSSPPTSSTRVFSRDGEWSVIKTDTVDATGQSRSSERRDKADGQEYSWGEGERIAMKKINDYRYEWTLKSESRGSGTGVSVLSKDGQTMTETYTGTNKGEKVHYVRVYDRQ